MIFIFQDVIEDELSSKDDSPSSTETDSGVGEAFSENSLSAEEEDSDNMQNKDPGIDGVDDLNEIGISGHSLNDLKTMKVSQKPNWW